MERESGRGGAGRGEEGKRRERKSSEKLRRGRRGRGKMHGHTWWAGGVRLASIRASQTSACLHLVKQKLPWQHTCTSSC